MTPLVPPQERLLIDGLEQFPAGRLLTNTVGRGQFAVAYARRHPQASVAVWLLDLFQTQQCRLSNHPLPANLALVCAADPPDGDVDMVAWMFSKQGDAELTREMLQLGHQRLADGRRLVAAIDNPRDRWLNERLQRLFPKVSRQPSDSGTVYSMTKQGALKKTKNYSAEFDFHDAERLIRLRTRPSVFSHRELDGGARALMKSLAVEPGWRVLEIGCGSGAVVVAAATREPTVTAHATDSNPRAIEATLWAARHNDLDTRLTAAIDCDGTSVERGAFELVVMNPPYYSNFRLAELFIRIADKALRAGGRLQVVTKMADWYLTHLENSYSDIAAEKVGAYAVISAQRRA